MRNRAAALLAGAIPVLAFPRAGLDWLAWIALVPGLLLFRYSPTGREAAVRGWWFGFGFLIAALYWLIGDIGPALPLLALVFGALWGIWAYAAWALLRPGRRIAAMVVLPSIWTVIEFTRSWHALGGPWALYGATQWRHPAMLGLAAVGGVWLVGFMIVAVNTALALRLYPVALLLICLGPAAYALRSVPSGPPLRIALVQTGETRGPIERFETAERYTRGLPPVDLTVWGESSVAFDLKQRTDLVARLTALHTPLLVNEDAADAAGRISKTAVLVGPDGVQARYVKNRLVPFGEYIPLRDAFGWLTSVSKAAKQDRVPGTGIETMRAGSLRFGPLICFESAFPDMAREEARRDVQLIVYQSSTSSFQHTWAPPQHAALGALRAAETGRPVVQAALTGVSAAFDAQGRRLAWLDTSRRGAVVVRVPTATGRTPYDVLGDYVPLIAVLVTAGAAAVALRNARKTGSMA